MGYLHINNLYKDQRVREYDECYAMEKIHGTSAHVAWRDGGVHFHHGGENREKFLACFNEVELRRLFEDMPLSVGPSGARFTIYGEAYGGKQQQMSHAYGKETRFVAFDVKCDAGGGEFWYDVPAAEALCKYLGLEFVHYVRCTTGLDDLNRERDAPSEQARRNGVDGDQIREGIVIRPIVEAADQWGDRIIAKHKRDDFRETATTRDARLALERPALDQAEAIAKEWVTEMRLNHVLDKVREAHGGADAALGIECTGEVIGRMVEDVIREAAGEIVDSKPARRAIGQLAGKMYRARVTQVAE